MNLLALLFFSLYLTPIHGLSILFPLYANPGTYGHGWDPFFSAVDKHPDLHFNVILNPSGAGPTTAPDRDYHVAVRRLYRYRNIRVLGYVTTGFGKRELGDIKKDVATYASWPPTARPQGIFFDEADKGLIPGSWASLSTLHAYTTSLIPSAYTILNAGLPPINNTLFSYANETVIFESTWVSYRAAIPAIDKVSWDPKRLAVMMYWVPDWEMTWQVFKFAKRGYGSLFLTDGGSFKAFFEGLGVFVEAVARLDGVPDVPASEDVGKLGGDGGREVGGGGGDDVGGSGLGDGDRKGREREEVLEL